MAPRIALLMEDNSECRTLLTELLAEKQLEVKAFTDPGAYLVTRLDGDCEAECPYADFIRSGNHKPGMSGVDFIAELETRGCKLPVDRKAIISGDWSQEERTRARLLGCRMFSQPYKVAEIYAWVDEQTAGEV